MFNAQLRHFFCFGLICFGLIHCSQGVQFQSEAKKKIAAKKDSSKTGVSGTGAEEKDSKNHKGNSSDGSGQEINVSGDGETPSQGMADDNGSGILDKLGGGAGLTISTTSAESGLIPGCVIEGGAMKLTGFGLGWGSSKPKITASQRLAKCMTPELKKEALAVCYITKNTNTLEKCEAWSKVAAANGVKVSRSIMFGDDMMESFDSACIEFAKSKCTSDRQCVCSSTKSN